MTRPQTSVEERLRARISAEIGIREDEITRDSSFLDDLGADSIDCVEIVMLAEEECGIGISDDDAEELTTFGALVAYVQAALARKAGAA